jgi:Eukaryotic initiation factor 4E
MATVATPSGSLLQTPFVFSYMRRGGANKKSGTNATEPEPAKAEDVAAGATNPRPQQQNPAMYETSIRTIAQVATVESFWETYDYLKRPNELPPVIDYHFFRVAQSVPIKPTWEDVSICSF